MPDANEIIREVPLVEPVLIFFGALLALGLTMFLRAALDDRAVRNGHAVEDSESLSGETGRPGAGAPTAQTAREEEARTL